MSEAHPLFKRNRLTNRKNGTQNRCLFFIVRQYGIQKNHTVIKRELMKCRSVLEAYSQFSHGISQQPKVMADSENFKCCIAGFMRYSNICGIGQPAKILHCQCREERAALSYRTNFNYEGLILTLRYCADVDGQLISPHS